jgi:hypothetical protein
MSVDVKVMHLHPDWTKTWSTWTIIFSDSLKFKTSFHLNLGGTMHCFFVGLMNGISCTNLVSIQADSW